MSNYAILIGLFFLAFVQEDSAVVSSALLGYNGVFPYWLTLVAVFPWDVGERFRDLLDHAIWWKTRFGIALGTAITTTAQNRSGITLV
jgi:hypothetical protein